LALAAAAAAAAGAELGAELCAEALGETAAAQHMPNSTARILFFICMALPVIR